jgi:hypothetical protein
VLHTHAFGQNAWGSLLGRLAGVPAVIAHEHNRDFDGRALHPVIDRELIARCSGAMIVVSEDARRRMKLAMGEASPAPRKFATDNAPGTTETRAHVFSRCDFLDGPEQAQRRG